MNMNFSEVYSATGMMGLIQQIGFLPLLDSGIEGFSAEDLYGREVCQCNRTPLESYQRIFKHLKEILPDASDKQIIKLIG